MLLKDDHYTWTCTKALLEKQELC